MRLYLFNLIMMCATALYSYTANAISVAKEPLLNLNYERNTSQSKIQEDSIKDHIMNDNPTSIFDEYKQFFKFFRNNSNIKCARNITKVNTHTTKFDEKTVLKISASNNAPFTFYNDDQSCFTGIEIRLMETIKRVLKVAVVYEYGTLNELKDMVETKYETHLVIIIIEIIRNNFEIVLLVYNRYCFIFIFSSRKPDIIIGGLDSNKVLESYKPTKPYFRNELTWCVKSAGQYPAWMNFFIVLNDISFLLVAVVSFYAVVTLFYALSITEGTYYDFHAATLVTFAIVLNTSTHYRPKRRVIQVIFLVAVFSCLWVNTTFLSFYAYQTTVPKYEAQVHTVKEIVVLDYRLMGESTSFTVLQENKMVDIILTCR